MEMGIRHEREVLTAGAQLGRSVFTEHTPRGVFTSVLRSVFTSIRTRALLTLPQKIPKLVETDEDDWEGRSGIVAA